MFTFIPFLIPSVPSACKMTADVDVNDASTAGTGSVFVLRVFRSDRIQIESVEKEENLYFHDDHKVFEI